MLEDIEICLNKQITLIVGRNNSGQPYVKEDKSEVGFYPIWKSWQQKPIEKKNLERKFAEIDLRAKTASDTSEKHAKRYWINLT